jgi:hypothetical protein
MICDIAFREELEALQSVYFDMKVEQLDDGSTMILHSFVPRDNRASFVAADVEITVPTTYPTTPPFLCILKSSGISHEGVGLLHKVKGMQDELHGEPHLFQLFDVIYEFLESSNAGECLFCADPLETSDTAGCEEGLIGIRTPCYHCFHLQCLCKWAAISLKKQETSKPEKAILARETSIIKGFEGQLRSVDMEASQLNDQIQKLNDEMVALVQRFPLCGDLEKVSIGSAPLPIKPIPSSSSSGKGRVATELSKRVARASNCNSGGSSLSQLTSQQQVTASSNIINTVFTTSISSSSSSSTAVKPSIAELRAQLAKVIESIRAAKTNEERKSLTANSHALRERIASLEAQEEEALEREKELKENGEMSARAMKDSLENSLRAANEKLERLTKR